MSLILIEAIDCFLVISGIRFPVFAQSINLLSLVSEALVILELEGPSATAKTRISVALLRKPGLQYLFDHHWYFLCMSSNHPFDCQVFESILDNASQGTFAAR